MNNEERKLWVRNDEVLYCCWKASRKSLAMFIKENKVFIDDHIKSETKR